ncbi:hypothetical protein M8C21_032009, partial [Ambrosia artemisiifolia]
MAMAQLVGLLCCKCYDQSQHTAVTDPKVPMVITTDVNSSITIQAVLSLSLCAIGDGVFQTHVLMVAGIRDGFRYEVDGGDASDGCVLGWPCYLSVSVGPEEKEALIKFCFWPKLEDFAICKGFLNASSMGHSAGDQTKGSPGGFILIIERHVSYVFFGVCQQNAVTGIPHAFTSESLCTFNHERSLAETFRCNLGSTR